MVAPSSTTQEAAQGIVQETIYNQTARNQIKAGCDNPSVITYIETLEAIAQAARILYLPPIPGENAIYALYDTLARVDWMNE